MGIASLLSAGSPFTWIYRLMGIYIILFVLSESITVWFGVPCLESLLCLPNHGCSIWQSWRLITYSFLHANTLHIGVNLWLFYSLARSLLINTLSTIDSD